MKLVCATDLHDGLSALRRILDHAGPVDAVLLGGDLTTFGRPGDVEPMLELCRQRCPRVFAIAGNCDSPQIEAWLVERGVSLHARGAVLEGVGLHGLSGIPPWKPRMYQFSEDELAAFLEAGYTALAGQRPLVSLVHCPPYGCTLDRTSSGFSAGSKAVREFVARRRPELLLCGHVHEGRGIEQLDDTLAVNCGIASEGYYALAEIGGGVRAELRRAPQ